MQMAESGDALQLSIYIVKRNDAFDVAVRIENPNLA